MVFDYKKFKKEICKEFGKTFSEEDIDKLLALEEGYDKDDPVSTGKRLRLSKIYFTGVKQDRSKIEYARKFDDGVNLWVADNLKGKSSLFKIIKLCLTGDNGNLKADVKEWLHKIYLEFTIGENIYTVYLNVKSVRAHGVLYSLKMDDIIGKSVDDVHVLFDVKTYREFEDEMQSFFFRQFSFYSLKWTQKSSKKDELALGESGTSWRTYYKSIYLESKDSGKLTYGSQNELIFQMLLGLELTYPINRLKIKKEKLEFELARWRESSSMRERFEDDDDQITLMNALRVVTEELKQLESSQEQPRELLDQSSAISENLQHTLKRIREAESLINQSFTELVAEKRARESLSEEIQEYQDNIHKLKRHNYRLQEYIDLGVFFSNLDITMCPHCNHPVDETRKIYEKKTHHCQLCNHAVEERPVDTKAHESKIQANKREIEHYTQQIELLNKKAAERNETIKHKENDIKKLRTEVQSLEQEKNRITLELTRLEAALRKSQAQRRSSESRRTELIEKRGVLQYKLKLLEENPAKTNIQKTISLYDAQIKVLQFAMQKLSEKRRTRSETILDKLRELMLSTLQDLGLSNISRVIIHPNFKISYTQNTIDVPFDEASEGEQQRVKLALYLSLIQLDIESSIGRHPRFLIIDTPAKEEADRHYLNGLTRALKTIDITLGDKLQIFVGTACRELNGVTESKKAQILSPGEYIF